MNHRTTLTRALLCAFVAALALAPPTLACAARLTGAASSVTDSYIEFALSCDKRPAISETFRKDPDRYVLTLKGTTNALSDKQAAALKSFAKGLIGKVLVKQSGADTELAFVLARKALPFVDYDDSGYRLRFYTGTAMEGTAALAPGVTLTQRHVMSQGEQLAVYILRADGAAVQPGGPLNVYSASAGRYDGKTRLRAPTSFAAKEAALCVLNGGFFGRAGQHLSTYIEDGVVRAAGVYPERPMLVVTGAGQLRIGRFTARTVLHFDGKILPVNGKNNPYESGKVLLYDSAYPLEELPQEAIYYYLLKDGKLNYHSTHTAGLALDADTLLLATDIIPEANPLRQIPPGASVEVETSITDDAGVKVPALSAIGGAPMLVENGAVDVSSKRDSVKDDIAKSRRARTAVGLAADGALLLVVVKELPDRSAGGIGLAELAAILADSGAVTALNFDGGGSTALAVNGAVLNIAEGAQRPVSNVLVLNPRSAEQQAAAQAGAARSKYDPQP